MKLSFNPRLVTDVIGKGNYQEFRSVIAEYVATAWDSEASEVHISIPDDFESGPIVISDNGKGIQDLDQFADVGANVQLRYPVSEEFRRNIMGKKGIGRFAGFACARVIKYRSTTDSRTIELSFDREELLKYDNIDMVDIPVIERPPESAVGTEVSLNLIDGSYQVPSPSQVVRDVLLDFGPVADFRVFVNGTECQPSQIPGEVLQVEEIHPVFGHVTGTIVVSKSRSKKHQAGVIVRVKHRRVEGPDFFGVEDSYSSKITNRIYGDINVDGLEDIITSGREAFIQHDQKYQVFKEWLAGKIVEAADRVQAKVETSAETIILNLDSFKSRIKRLPPHLQRLSRDYVKRVGPKLNRLRNDRSILEVFGLLILRASENADFHAVLSELERTENMDIAGLAKVLQRWGFSEITYASSLSQRRLQVLGRFADVINDDDALELQDIHKLIESNTWLLDDRYSLFASNQGLRNIIEKLQHKYEGRNGRKRPDLILKRNRDDFVLVELKAPDVKVTMVEVEQALEYKSDIAEHHPEARQMDVYVVGRRFNKVVTEQYFEGNPQRVHALSLGAIFQQANDRISWLSKNLEEEYEFAAHGLAPQELLPEMSVANE